MNNINNKTIIAIVVIAAVLIAGYLFLGSAATISVEGTSVIKAVPDEVSVQITVQTRNNSLNDAQSANNVQYEQVINALKSIGFTDSDIKLDSYSSYQDYVWDGVKQRENGFVVYRQLSVVLKNFTSTSSVIDKVVSSGATVSYINFELSQEKQNELKAQALKEAGEDAKVKAKAAASGFGKHLGGLVSVELVDFSYGPYPYYVKSADLAGGSAASEARLAAANIAPRDLEVPATVRAVYKIGAF